MNTQQHERISRNIDDAMEFLTRVRTLLSCPETPAQAAAVACIRAAIEATRGAKQMMALDEGC